VNVNVADREALLAVVGAVRVVDSLVKMRPFADVAELGDVAGIDSGTFAFLTHLLTTRGSGQINVNAAPPEVLAAVPGLTSEAIGLILRWRAIGQRVTSSDALAASISPPARNVLYGDYQDFLRAATFAPNQLIVTVAAGVHGTQLVAHETLTAVPLPERLAVVRREVE
jgi:type II secretory pathway component PulK